MKILIIIPAYNEATVIGGVIDSVHAIIPDADLLVVDDGSYDETFSIAKQHHVIVVRHRMNRGLGGAIGTGLSWAKLHRYDVAVTFDADGQHQPTDIINAIQPIINHQADVVIGSRFQGIKNMPWDRKVLNTLANGLTFLLFGIPTTDSQSGFRAFNKKAIESINIRTDRMEVSSEIFGEAYRLHLKIQEIPIKVIYTEYSRTKGQRNSNSFPILFRLIMRIFR